MPNGQPNGYSNAKLSFVPNISERGKDIYQGKYSPGCDIVG